MNAVTPEAPTTVIEDGARPFWRRVSDAIVGMFGTPRATAAEPSAPRPAGRIPALSVAGNAVVARTTMMAKLRAPLPAGRAVPPLRRPGLPGRWKGAHRVAIHGDGAQETA